MTYRNEITQAITYYNKNVVVISLYQFLSNLLQWNYRSNNLLQRKCRCNKLVPIIFVVYCNEIAEAISYYNKNIVVITIVYCNEITVALTYYLGVYCNGSQRLFGRCNKLYCNENRLIATTFFVVINDFSCSVRKKFQRLRLLQPWKLRTIPNFKSYESC